jgi:hypothetical protein
MTAPAFRALVGFLAVTLATAADLSDEAKERFLREAEVVSAAKLTIGVTASRRVTLSDGALTHDAHFQDVDTLKHTRRGPGAPTTEYRDSYRFNIAAYRLDRLLGLGIAPVSVERTYEGRPGALTWWVDDVLMMELERWTKNVRPPDKDAWNDQIHQARVFNGLIYNSDSNLENVLVDKSWKIWLIDFTRAFRTEPTLRSPKSLGRIDRRVWNGLRRLDDANLRQAMGPILLDAERDALLARRDEIVRLLEQRIAEKGESAVICDLPGH